MFSKRKWGWYLVLWQWPLFSKGPRYKLKLLYFKKGGALSKQKHKHRVEWWDFLIGNGEFFRGGEGDEWGYWLTKDISNHLVPENFWHQYIAYDRTLVLETQRGICREDDIERG